MNQYSSIIDINEDTWGFYVDIEKDEKIKYKPKYLTYDNDYYDYYYEKYDEYNEYNEYNENNEYKPKSINKNITNLLIRVSSTTLVTIGISYLLFCIL